MVSSAPDCSPASIKLQNRSSKCSRGCALIAAAKLFPPDTSALIFLIRSFIAALSTPPATISKDWTSGTPAFIMVASCLVKIATSAGVILAPIEKRLFPCFFTDFAVMPCFLKAAFTEVGLPAFISPEIFFPDRLVPVQLYRTSSAMDLSPTSDHS